MAEQYWVGDFFVDLTRNQITQKMNSQTIAPKALAVLTYLAQHQGQVVSHDALLANVWQNTAVTPNTLQRSIAQLRKALGDDGKVQRYIKTHAKQGYSLECQVQWQGFEAAVETHISQVTLDKSTVDQAIDKPTKLPSNVLKLALRFIFIIIGIIFLSITGYKYLTPSKPSTLSFDTVRSLTATDDKEFDATYSPDGQFIVFHRYLDKQCVNKIWAKNIETQQEFQLTESWGNYGPHSFSKDGKRLVFFATEPCIDPSNQSRCFDLVSLDFEKALQNPQEPNLILRCENTQLKKPLWIGEDHIAILQLKLNRWKLIRYSISQNKSSDLYNKPDGNIIDYAFSARENLIAITSFRQDGHQYLDLLKPDGELLSSNQIIMPPEIPKYRPVNPNFSSQEGQLIFSTGRRLFTLSFQGDVAKVSLPFADRMIQPEFHPDGSKLLMLKGPYDSDITLGSLEQIVSQAPKTHLDQPAPLESFERSNLGEDYATFQPGGDLIAFWSERSGEEQIWISDGRGAYQLTNFPVDTYIRGIDWARDGQSLLVNANYGLTRVYLDSREQTLALTHPVIRLYQWNSAHNSALILARIGGLSKLVEYDLNQAEFREITDKTVLWADKSEDGRIVFKDNLSQFWQPGPVEDEQIKALANQRHKSKSFIINGNQIVAIRKENQLWSYDLNTENFRVLGEVGQDVDYITDMNQTQFLITVQVSAKKEVVELSVNQ